jgi:phage gpG-like protein
MITIKSNIGQVTGAIAERLKVLINKEYLLRPVAFGLIDKMTQRIHVEGKASDGGAIGNYNSNYLKQRQRKPYNRTSDAKIIVSLTRQLENDWSVIATDRGYGIGFKNSFNLQKARWVEQGKGKNIFDLTANEQAYATEYLNELITDALNT